jgi:hypothetical protein
LLRWLRQISRSLFKTAFTLKGIHMQNVLISATAAPAVSSAPSAATTPVVVQNDNSGAALQGTVVMRQYFEQLAAERLAWQEGALRTSNEQLYVLLQKCYQTYHAMGGTSAEAEALRGGFTDYINTKGLKFKKSTHTIAKIVQCVFGQDRRRISAYSIVLRSALSQKIGVLDFADFVRNAGGVEEVRLAKSPNAMTAKQKAVVAGSAVTAANLGVFASAQLNQLLDAGKVGTNTLLIGTWQADGSVVVRAVVESEGALNAALASYYSANKTESKAKVVEQTAANEANAMQGAVTYAVANALVNA